MIDQYISCGEDKWNNQNGIVLLLPHGYEGQGAEHSSGRMDVIYSCAQDTTCLWRLTTPANFFHLFKKTNENKLPQTVDCIYTKSLLRDQDVFNN
jgi:2-oxoglutarate dehydrogenase E1 component